MITPSIIRCNPSPLPVSQTPIRKSIDIEPRTSHVHSYTPQAIPSFAAYQSTELSKSLGKSLTSTKTITKSPFESRTSGVFVTLPRAADAPKIIYLPAVKVNPNRIAFSKSPKTSPNKRHSTVSYSTPSTKQRVSSIYQKSNTHPNSLLDTPHSLKSITPFHADPSIQTSPSSFPEVSVVCMYIYIIM
jgi:hypothetical protein